jgi:hypothetical protein
MTSDYKVFLNKTILTSFNFELINNTDIDKIIRSLKTKLSSGEDGISTKLLKAISPAVIEPLTIIINQSLLTGIFPQKLKIAKVVPIFKSKDKSDINNYRPVSLLPAISKVFERVVYNQLYNYLKQNNLLHKNQFGFRPEHSTELACISLIDRILEYLDKGKIPVCIYMDLSKAFDTLNFDILLYKLNYYGVSSVALNWFRSYLYDRTQFTQLDDYRSETKVCNTGVPQGSILGPLLFLIYINDIPYSNNNFDFFMYADDTTLFTSVDRNVSTNQVQTINNNLQKVYNWLAANQLSLNIGKTKFMCFHPNINIKNIMSSLKINGIDIERVNNINFLGLNIDENISWKAHTDKLAAKLSQYSGILNSLKRYLPSHILKSIYSTMINSSLNYCILAWGFASNNLNRLQKRLVRTVAGAKYNAHTEPIFKNLNLLKLEDIFKLNMLKFYYKLINDKLPDHFTNFNLIQFNTIHTYDTRHNHHYRVTITNTSYARKCLRHALPSLINSLQPLVLEMVHTHSYKGFTQYVKNTLISQYLTECLLPNCYICNQQN